MHCQCVFRQTTVLHRTSRVLSQRVLFQREPPKTSENDTGIIPVFEDRRCRLYCRNRNVTPRNANSRMSNILSSYPTVNAIPSDPNKARSARGLIVSKFHTIQLGGVFQELHYLSSAPRCICCDLLQFYVLTNVRVSNRQRSPLQR
jgi:hypothetical protein